MNRPNQSQAYGYNDAKIVELERRIQKLEAKTAPLRLLEGVYEALTDDNTNNINDYTDVATDGYLYLGPVLIQWGNNPDMDTSGGAETTSFPIAFSSNPYTVQAICTSVAFIQLTAFTSTGFSAIVRDDAGTALDNRSIYWLAIGPA